MVSIEDVFKLVRQEREYQKNKWGELHDEDKSLEAFLLIIEGEVKEAKKGWLKNKRGRNSPGHEILQVAAVCIACLEHTMPPGILGSMKNLSTPKEE